MTPVGITPDRVSACLVTRGNVPLDPILETLKAYDEIVIHDNSKEARDEKVAGRYRAAARARNDVVYFQDDDVIFTHHAELLAEYEPGVLVANDAHGPNPGGYDDLALCAAGSVVDSTLVLGALHRYGAVHEIDDGYFYEADFIAGLLVPFRHVVLPYTRLYADDMTRLCNQPWQEALKLKITERARAIRGPGSLEQPGSATIARSRAARGGA